MSLIVEVTQEDIDKGVCDSATKCAVARAIKRLTRRQQVRVDGESAYIFKDRYEAELPKKAQTFISKFDSDKRTVTPFSFVLKNYKRIGAK